MLGVFSMILRCGFEIFWKLLLCFGCYCNFHVYVILCDFSYCHSMLVGLDLSHCDSSLYYELSPQVCLFCKGWKGLIGLFIRAGFYPIWTGTRIAGFLVMRFSLDQTRAKTHISKLR